MTTNDLNNSPRMLIRMVNEPQPKLLLRTMGSALPEVVSLNQGSSRMKMPMALVLKENSAVDASCSPFVLMNKDPNIRKIVVSTRGAEMGGGERILQTNIRKEESTLGVTSLRPADYVKVELGNTPRKDVRTTEMADSCILVKEEPTFKDEPLDDMEVNEILRMAPREAKSSGDGPQQCSSNTGTELFSQGMAGFGFHSATTFGEPLHPNQQNKVFQCNVPTASSSKHTVILSTLVAPANQRLLFKCDICHKMFSKWDEGQKCFRSHIIPFPPQDPQFGAARSISNSQKPGSSTDSVGLVLLSGSLNNGQRHSQAPGVTLPTPKSQPTQTATIVSELGKNRTAEECQKDEKRCNCNICHKIFSRWDEKQKCLKSHIKPSQLQDPQFGTARNILNSQKPGSSSAPVEVMLPSGGLNDGHGHSQAPGVTLLTPESQPTQTTTIVNELKKNGTPEESQNIQKGYKCEFCSKTFSRWYERQKCSISHIRFCQPQDPQSGTSRNILNSQKPGAASAPIEVIPMSGNLNNSQKQGHSQAPGVTILTTEAQPTQNAIIVSELEKNRTAEESQTTQELDNSKISGKQKKAIWTTEKTVKLLQLIKEWYPKLKHKESYCQPGDWKTITDLMQEHIPEVTFSQILSKWRTTKYRFLRYENYRKRRSINSKRPPRRPPKYYDLLATFVLKRPKVNTCHQEVSSKKEVDAIPSPVPLTEKKIQMAVTTGVISTSTSSPATVVSELRENKTTDDATVVDRSEKMKTADEPQDNQKVTDNIKISREQNKPIWTTQMTVKLIEHIKEKYPLLKSNKNKYVWPVVWKTIESSIKEHMPDVTLYQILSKWRLMKHMFFRYEDYRKREDVSKRGNGIGRNRSRRRPPWYYDHLATFLSRSSEVNTCQSEVSDKEEVDATSPPLPLPEKKISTALTAGVISAPSSTAITANGGKTVGEKVIVCVSTAAMSLPTPTVVTTTRDMPTEKETAASVTSEAMSVSTPVTTVNTAIQGDQVWTREMTVKLIHSVKEKYPMLKGNTTKRSKVWKAIHDSLQGHIPERTFQQLASRWRYLKFSFLKSEEQRRFDLSKRRRKPVDELIATFVKPSSEVSNKNEVDATQVPVPSTEKTSQTVAPVTIGTTTENNPVQNRLSGAENTEIVLLPRLSSTATTAVVTPSVMTTADITAVTTQPTNTELTTSITPVVTSSKPIFPQAPLKTHEQFRLPTGRENLFQEMQGLHQELKEYVTYFRNTREREMQMKEALFKEQLKALKHLNRYMENKLNSN